MSYVKDIHHLHDKWYKTVLSKKEVCEQFLKTFIHEPWTERVSSSNMVLVDKSFVLPDFFELEADLIYKTKFGNEDVYFYILMEMQSSVDFSMPIRLFYYMGEIWRDGLKNLKQSEIKRKDFKLPSIIPIILYNGEQPWTVSTNFKYKVRDFELFGKHVINFEYILLDVNRYSKEELIQCGNLPAALFFLDQIVEKKDFVERLKIVALEFTAMTRTDKQQLKHWLERILDEEFNESIKDMMTKLLISENKAEVEKMTANIVKTWIAEKAEAREEGMEQGMHLKEIEVARNLLMNNIDEAIIIKSTGITKEQLEALKSEV